MHPHKVEYGYSNLMNMFRLQWKKDNAQRQKRHRLSKENPSKYDYLVSLFDPVVKVLVTIPHSVLYNQSPIALSSIFSYGTCRY